MKKLFYLTDSIQNKISFYHLLCFLVFLPFDRFYSTIVLLSFLIHTLIYLKRSQLKNIGRETLILPSVFFVTILSSVYAGSFAASMNVASKQLGILLFPLLLSVTELDLPKYRSLLLKSFGIVCTAAIVYLFYDALKVIRYQQLPLKTLFSSAFVNQNFSLPVSVHATYLSMYVVVSLVYFVKTIIESNSRSQKTWMCICSAILLAGLLQLGSKSVLVTALIIFNVCVPWLLLRQRQQYRYLMLSLSVSLVLVAAIFSSGVFRERYLADFKNEFTSTKEITENWRIDRWKASLSLIASSPILGNGSGMEIPLLRNIYYEKKMYVPFLHSMNVHNQFLSFLITSGIIGLLLYLATLYWGFSKAIRGKDLFLLAFMLLVAIVSFSEDMLDVNKGIFFYAFFFSFFILSQKSQHKQPFIDETRFK